MEKIKKVTFKVTCCEGENGNCLKDLCPHYRKAKGNIEQSWPYVGTGFGNMYGNPGHGHFLREVKEILSKRKANKHKGKRNETK